MRDAVCGLRPVQARLPILIGGSGPTKTLRTTARYADLWNAFGTPEAIAETSGILAQRCAEVGRRFDEIERTVTIHAVIRDTPAQAYAAWDEIARIHGLDGHLGSDGGERGLLIGGSPRQVAAYVDGYRRNGIGEVMFVFRSPFDLETIGASRRTAGRPGRLTPQTQASMAARRQSSSASRSTTRGCLDRVVAKLDDLPTPATDRIDDLGVGRRTGEQHRAMAGERQVDGRVQPVGGLEGVGRETRRFAEHQRGLRDRPEARRRSDDVDGRRAIEQVCPGRDRALRGCRRATAPGSDRRPTRPRTDPPADQAPRPSRDRSASRSRLPRRPRTGAARHPTRPPVVSRARSSRRRPGSSRDAAGRPRRPRASGPRRTPRRAPDPSTAALPRPKRTPPRPERHRPEARTRHPSRRTANYPARRTRCAGHGATPGQARPGATVTTPLDRRPLRQRKPSARARCRRGAPLPDPPLRAHESLAAITGPLRRSPSRCWPCTDGLRSRALPQIPWS